MTLFDELPFPLVTNVGQFTLGKIGHAELVTAIDVDLTQDLDLVPGLRDVFVALRQLIVECEPERPSNELLSYVYTSQMRDRIEDWRAPRLDLRRRLAVVTDGMWPANAGGWPADFETVASTYGTVVKAPRSPFLERQPAEILAEFDTGDEAVNFYLDYCTDEDGEQSKGRGLLARLQRATGLPVTSTADILGLSVDAETDVLAPPDSMSAAMLAELTTTNAPELLTGVIGGRRVFHRTRTLQELDGGYWHTGADYFSSVPLAHEFWRPRAPSPFRVTGLTPPPRHEDPDIADLDSGSWQAQFSQWLDQEGLPATWAVRHHVEDLDDVDPEQRVVATTTPVIGLHLRSQPGEPFGPPVAVCNSRRSQFWAAVSAVRAFDLA